MEFTFVLVSRDHCCSVCGSFGPIEYSIGHVFGLCHELSAGQTIVGVTAVYPLKLLMLSLENLHNMKPVRSSGRMQSMQVFFAARCS